jgi:hypothetical protein
LIPFLKLDQFLQLRGCIKPSSNNPFFLGLRVFVHGYDPHLSIIMDTRVGVVDSSEAFKDNKYASQKLAF